MNAHKPPGNLRNRVSLGGPGDPQLAHHDEERVPLAQIDSVEQGLRAWLSSR